MKSFLLLPAAALGFLCTAHAQPVSESLLSNGDFEEAVSGESWPAGWTREEGAPVRWEEEDGRHFIRLTAPQPDQVIAFSRVIDLPAGAAGVDLAIRFRVAGFRFGTNASGAPVYAKDMRFSHQALDAAGEPVPKGGGGFVLDSHAKDWKDVERRVLLPDGAVKLKVGVVLDRIAAGTLDVDAIEVKRVPDAELAAARQAIADAARKAEEDRAEIARLLVQPGKTEAIKVQGNRLVTADGRVVWLQGVNVPSLEWSAKGEDILRSIKVAIDDWKANVIRLPVHDAFWFGRGKPPKVPPNDAEAYRKVVDEAIALAAARGAYVILDLHRFHAPDERAVEFWKDAAARYRNHPAVLFDLYNEPTGIPWETWRNGGTVPVKAKNGEPATSFASPGMQGLLEAVRSTGAKNIVIAGGVGFAYDLSGVLNGFALEDSGGNGIIYATHFYNWHRGWEKNFLLLAEKYPLLVGEFGADIKKMSFIPAKNQEDPFTWVPDALALVQKYHLNWTAFSLHPKATPVLIQDWDYTPTPFWGVFVKEALGGRTFELKKLR